MDENDEGEGVSGNDLNSCLGVEMNNTHTNTQT